jgi:hypothetical protein
VSVSEEGASSGTLRVYDTVSLKPLPDIIALASFTAAEGSLAWKAGDTGFYYLRAAGGAYTKGTETPHIYFHKLGTTAAADSLSLGREFPADAQAFLSSTANGRFNEATVASQSGAILSYNIVSPSGTWATVATFTAGCSLPRTPAVTECEKDCRTMVGPGGLTMAQCLSGCAQLGKTCPSNPPPGSSTITIPYDYIQSFLQFALAGSRIQLSQMDHGQARNIRETRRICTFHRTPEVVECRQHCADLVKSSGMTMAQCLSGCARLGQTCNDVSGEFPENSYIWWTPELRRLSGVDPSTMDTKLQNKFLFIPLFTRGALLRCRTALKML